MGDKTVLFISPLQTYTIHPTLQIHPNQFLREKPFFIGQIKNTQKKLYQHTSPFFDKSKTSIKFHSARVS